MMELSNSTVKTPEAESETPTRIQQQPATALATTKPSPCSNGVLKRHPPLQHLQSHHHLNHHPVVVTYKECLKNHAATLGGHALDGCGEFMPSPTSNPSDPTSLKCAACSCHRNFHRREPEDAPALLAALPALEYQPHHRHHPPPPPPRVTNSSSPNNSPSPPPISSSYYPSAPHMLLALSHGHVDNNNTASTNPTAMIDATTSTAVLANVLTPSGSASRKRFRTKFTQEQKDRMLEFAERVGWKMQKRDEDIITEFCNEVGVDKGVFKVWMHNNKSTFSRKPAEHQHVRAQHNHSSSAISTPVLPVANSNGNGSTVNYGDGKQNVSHVHQVHQDMSSGHVNVNVHGHDNHPLGNNGSSSSS